VTHLEAQVIAQTVQFAGITAEALYDAYLSSKQHAAMTVDGTQHATFYRASEGEVPVGQVGDELRAFGALDAAGKMQYSLRARVLHLVPGKLIVMSWKNKVWDLALDPSDVTDLASTCRVDVRFQFRRCRDQAQPDQCAGIQSARPRHGRDRAAQ
jgi:hypothetical protein